MPIRVLIVDDHTLVRAGLRLLLSAQPDLQVVGEATDGHQALLRGSALSPDVTTMDISMPGTGGIKTVQRMVQQSSTTRVLVLTMHDDPAYLRAVFAVGGAGYLLKTAMDTELVAAIRAVHAGRIVVDARLTDQAGCAGVTQLALSRVRTRLSAREQQALVLLGQGYTNQEIADRLVVSVKSAETYRRRICRKLGLRGRADLVRFAFETGLLNAEPSVSSLSGAEPHRFLAPAPDEK